MDLSSLFTLESLIVKGILLLVSFPIHEWAHAWTAYRLGDDTAALQGRLTLNPLVHWDPIGTVAMLISSYGWGKPVPVLPHRLRGNMRASMALVSFAGPFSNLVIAMLAAIPFRLGWLSLYTKNASAITPQGILVNFILINLSLMLFNLIPIPPLDGSRIMAWLLPRRWAYVMDQLERIGGMGLLLIIFFLSWIGILGLFMSPVYWFMLNALLVY